MLFLQNVKKTQKITFTKTPGLKIKIEYKYNKFPE